MEGKEVTYFIITMALLLIGFACGWAVGHDTGWWSAYQDYAPSIQDEERDR